MNGVVKIFNLFLRGQPGIGKSTLIKEVLEYIDCSIGGFIEEKIKDGDRTFYDMISLYDGQSGNIIGVSDKLQNKVTPFSEVFEKEGLEILKNSYESRNLIVMDELGFLESNSINFQKFISIILDSNKVVFGVLKECNCDFINNIAKRNDVILLNVTDKTRAYLKNEILNILSKFNIPLKKI